MKLCDRLGITPECWKDSTLEEFQAVCKGYISTKEIEAKWKELQKMFPAKKKKKEIVKPIIEEGTE